MIILLQPVLDFSCCCPDSYHVSVDTVHPSLLRVPLLLLQGGTICSAFLPTHFGLVSLRVQTNPVSLSAPLCDILYPQTLTDVITFLTWSLGVWPHAHLHFFISATYIVFFVWELFIDTFSTPVQHILWIFPLTYDGILLFNYQHRTAVIGLQYAFSCTDLIYYKNAAWISSMITKCCDRQIVLQRIVSLLFVLIYKRCFLVIATCSASMLWHCHSSNMNYPVDVTK